MTSYYNIFENTEFIIQNSDTNKTYKTIKQIYQSGGDNTTLIYEDNNPKHMKKYTNTNTNTNTKFFNSCKQPKIQKFKQHILQIGGFNIQL